MKVSERGSPEVAMRARAEVATGAVARASERGLLGRMADYAELSKLRVNLLVLFVTAVGFFLGAAGAVDVATLLWCLLGVTALGCGASALNQYLERESDVLMSRTRERPLPLGRLRPFEALAFGLVTGIAGVLLLALRVGPTASIVGAVTFLSYVLVYTPMKRRSPHALFVGAVPGALPPIIGWAAASGSLSADAWAIFTVLFVWQIPHFLAIAWLYRRDYAAADIPTFAGVDREGRQTSFLMLASTLVLVGASYVPLVTADRGAVYFWGATLAGVIFLVPVVLFGREIGKIERAAHRARLVVRLSIVYLPLLLFMLIIERIL